MKEAPENPVMSVCESAGLSEPALSLLDPDARPLEFLDRLVGKRLYPDAVRFLAHSLPKRECIWWGWVCARRASGEKPAPKVKSALDATERWITHPNEENRRVAKQASDAAGLETAAGCAALAVFFSGGSLAAPEAPPVPPGETLSAKAISGAVIIAALKTEPEKAPAKFQSYIAQGIEVTQKIKLWEGRSK